MAGENIKKLTDDNFLEETRHGVTLVDFYADWCGPCRMMTPILDKVADELKGKATVAKIDIDHSQKTAATFQVTSIPTLVLVRDGKEVNRLVGLRDADSVKSFVLAAI